MKNKIYFLVLIATMLFLPQGKLSARTASVSGWATIANVVAVKIPVGDLTTKAAPSSKKAKKLKKRLKKKRKKKGLFALLGGGLLGFFFRKKLKRKLKKMKREDRAFPWFELITSLVVMAGMMLLINFLFGTSWTILLLIGGGLLLLYLIFAISSNTNTDFDY